MPASCRYAVVSGVVLFAIAVAASFPAFAASQRSFVSTAGVDNAACSIGAPCRSFGAAVTATNAGGEVVVLDSGGYGAVTITQSVSIIAAPGVYAGISVFSGHGVTIATAGPTSLVVLRGLSINNQGSTGRGIFISGEGIVRIENAQVSGFTAASALNATPSGALQLHVRDSTFRQSNYGIALNYTAAATQQISGTLERVEISNNNIDGLGIGNNVFMTLTRSLVAKNNGVGVGFLPAAGQIDHLNVDDCEIAENTQGLYPGDTPGSTTLQVSRSRVVGNGTGLAIGSNSTTRLSENVIENNGYGITIGTGAVESAGNNVLRGNANNEPLLPTFALR